MIPNAFEAWESHIINDCKINLTKDFAKSRLFVYQNTKRTLELPGWIPRAKSAKYGLPKLDKKRN